MKLRMPWILFWFLLFDLTEERRIVRPRVQPCGKYVDCRPPAPLQR